MAGRNLRKSLATRMQSTPPAKINQVHNKKNKTFDSDDEEKSPQSHKKRPVPSIPVKRTFIMQPQRKDRKSPDIVKKLPPPSKQQQLARKASPQVKEKSTPPGKENSKMMTAKKSSPPVIEITEGRSRRTPKPNPKYANEDLVTSFKAPTIKTSNISTGTRSKPSKYKSESDESDAAPGVEDDDKVDISSEDENFSVTEEEDSSEEEDNYAPKLTRSKQRISNDSIKQSPPAKLSPGRLYPIKKITSSTITKPPITKVLTTSAKLSALKASTPVAKISTSTSTPVASKGLVGPGIRNIITASMDRQKLQTNKAAVHAQLNALRKRKLEEEKNESSNKQTFDISDSSDDESSSSSVQFIDKRLDMLRAHQEARSKKESQKPTLAQQKRLLDAIRAAKAQQITKGLQEKLVPKTKQISTPPSRPKQEQPKQEIQKSRQDTPKQDPTKNKSDPVKSKEPLKPMQPVKSDIKTLQSKPSSITRSIAVEEEKDPIGTDTVASTLEDFETMPTFTIVNVNDIIGKKGDVLQEESEEKSNKINNTKIIIKSPTSKKDESESEDTNQIETISLLDSPTTNIKNKQNSLLSRNRRKAMHTTILSDKVKSDGKPPPRTPFPPIRKPSVITPSNAKTKSITPMTSGTRTTKRSVSPAFDEPPSKRANNRNSSLKSDSGNRSSSMESLKLSPSPQKRPVSIQKQKQTNFSQKASTATQKQTPPPRVLNAIIAKKPAPILTKSSPIQQQLQKNPIKSKENQQINATATSGNKSEISLPISPVKRKTNLPSEKVVIQRQGNKIIKKITCFETWYVINIPSDDEDASNITSPPQSSQFGRKFASINKVTTTGNKLKMPLIDLANNVEAIELPSEKWIPKVTLQKTNASVGEIYTGKITDTNFHENDRNTLIPLNVMFRRVPQKPTPKLPYDRAVIFKNETFFTNIEGRNIKLIDAPKEIKNFNEIEILLEIIDDLNLNSNFVEPASYLG